MEEQASTYVLEGLTSSIFLWKGCCVGVAAETEMVDELYASGQYAGRSLRCSSVRTMMKQRRSITSSDVHQGKCEAARPRSSVVGTRKVCGLLVREELLERSS